MSVKVKVCGITTLEDAQTALRFGADALGFIFFKRSARFISPRAVKAILAKLPPFVTTVGVFVDSPVKEINDTIRQSGIDTVQLHGSETPKECSAVKGARVIKAFRVSGAKDINGIGKYDVAANLLDTFVEGTHGGTGKTFDWNIAVKAGNGTPLILSGGLTPDNVKEAIKTVKPYAVDVSSGVESAPGVKSAEKLKRFLKIAKSR